MSCHSSKSDLEGKESYSASIHISIFVLGSLFILFVWLTQLSGCLLDGSSLCDISSGVNEISLAMEMDMHTKFSIWVSFCEIYNENIHDLLEQHASNASRRANLRLCQDVKGNSFIKGKGAPVSVTYFLSCQ